MTEFSGLPLTVKTHPRAKRVLVKLIPHRGLEVVTPQGFPSDRIPDILESKRTWITHTRSQLESRGVNLKPEPRVIPDTIDYRALDRTYEVHTLIRPGRLRLTENGNKLVIAMGSSETETALDALRRHTAKKAREFLLPLLDEKSKAMNLPYSAMRVRRQKTRWGSCSAKGVISMNAKLLFLPFELVDQLLLHELCHLRHMDHSPRFWALVARYQPDFENLEHRLSRAGHLVPSWFF